MYQKQRSRLVPRLALLSIVDGAAEGSRDTRDTRLVCTPTPQGRIGGNRGCNLEQEQVHMRWCYQAGMMDKPNSAGK